MSQRGGGDHEILFAIRHAAMILAPRDFAGIGGQIRASDMMMLAHFGAAQAREERFGLVRASTVDCEQSSGNSS